jgi:predicted component of viral defense system (DUF524 family)
MSVARTALRDESNQAIGWLTIARLPGRSDPLSEHPDSGRPVLAEGGDYHFEIDVEPAEGAVAVEPSTELFSFDDTTCRRGRIRPRQFVGRIRVRVDDPSTGQSGYADIEVRPTKLEAEAEYRHMLRDIEDVATEALLHGFAPAALSLTTDSATTPELLYQQFALLHAKLVSREFEDSMALILANPHRAWIDEREDQHPGRPLRAGGHLSRALARSGPRVKTYGRLSLGSVPRRVERSRTESTLDSIPNRFVLYALSRWRSVAQRLADALGPLGSEPGPIRRGRDAAAEILTRMDRHLGHPLFREVAPLRVFPMANQVLLKQAGYRDLFRTFALGEVGSRLALDLDLDDVFAASQRNAAALYEYWTFLQLADAVGTVCGAEKTVEALQPARDGLSIGFRQGVASGLHWHLERAGREFEITLFFNRTFLVSTSYASDVSWSRAMRPDCSLHIRPQSRTPTLAHPGDLDVWLHFDAKYRVEYLREQFDASEDLSENAAAEAESIERWSRSRREDLLKMHAYRDAIRRTAGAYVLFPGNENLPPYREFQELLPGLGAFMLRPASSPAQSGRTAIEKFLSDVIDHAADRATQHERERFWRAQVRRTPESVSSAAVELPEIALPPRDALVLCGYVRGHEQQSWIETSGLYNVRADRRRGALSADSSELRGEWVLLYGANVPVSLWERIGGWFVQTRDDLLELGYPRPRGAAYLCCPVTRHAALPHWLDDLDVGGLRSAELPTGHPFAVNWSTLLAAGTTSPRSFR